MLGIGPFILPRFFGMQSAHDFPEAVTPPPAWIKKALLALATGVLILISFVLEAGGWFRSGHGLRCAAVAAYLWLELPIHSAPKAGTALGVCLRIALLMLLLGFLATAFFPGYRVSLLHLTLMASDNAAARALARVSSLGSEAFIERMNTKAAELGLQSTSYSDPSGLLAANVSSAYDMAKLISYVSGDERISGVMRKQTYTVNAGRRAINIHSTNQLVMNGDVDVQAGKTGFISKSGYCLAALLRLPQGGPPVAVVVLGAKSNAGRFWETRHLFNWFASKAEDLLGTPLQAATAGATAN